MKTLHCSSFWSVLFISDRRWIFQPLATSASDRRWVNTNSCRTIMNNKRPFTKHVYPTVCLSMNATFFIVSRSVFPSEESWRALRTPALPGVRACTHTQKCARLRCGASHLAAGTWFSKS